MSAINPLGSQTFWFNGLPAEALFPEEGGPVNSRAASTAMWL